MALWLPVGLTAVIQLVVAVFLYGQLYQKVHGHADLLRDHEKRLRVLERGEVICEIVEAVETVHNRQKARAAITGADD